MGRERDSRAVGGDFDWEDWDDDGDRASGNGRGANSKLTLHVGNLGENATEEQVRELFEQHGTVTNCIIPEDHRSSKRDDNPPQGLCEDTSWN